jgi:hypothetical protein
MYQSLSQFWHANSGAILISLMTGLLFFVLGPLGLWFSGRRIRRERRRRASQALLDLIEDMLVSAETIDSANLSALFRAVERETDVILEGFYDADTLFEDLALRFARSRHLDAAQKNKYADEIKRISKDLTASAEMPAEKHIPRAYAKILDDLKIAIGANDTKRAGDLTGELEERLVTARSDDRDMFTLVFRRYLNLYKRHPIISFIAVILVVLFYAWFFMTITGKLKKNGPSPQPTPSAAVSYLRRPAHSEVISN